MSAARPAATYVSTVMVNDANGGAVCVVDVTAETATAAVVVTIQGLDAASGKFHTLLASASLASVATTVLNVHIGMTAAGNLVANQQLPRLVRISAVVSGTNTITFSVGCSFTS